MKKEKIDFIFEKYRQFSEIYSERFIKTIVNGAGPAGKGEWVRDTLFYKYCVTDAANVHDFLYSVYGPTEISRKDADDFFLLSMLASLEKQTEISKILNKPLIYIYYFAVRTFGWSFWTKEKNN